MCLADFVSYYNIVYGNKKVTKQDESRKIAAEQLFKI